MVNELGIIEKMLAVISATSVKNGLFPKVMDAFTSVFKDTQVTYKFKLGSPDPRAIKDLENRIIVLSQKTTDRLKGDLRFSLLEGMQEGEGADKLSRRIKDVFDGDEVNTERIARNEIINSSKAGTLEAYADAGVWGREWMTIPGDRTCAVCKKLNGRVAKMGTWFKSPITGDDLVNDSAHVLCRCSTKPIMDDPEAANND